MNVAAHPYISLFTGAAGLDGCRGCPNYMISKHQCVAVLHSKKCPATGIPYWCPLPVLKEEERDGTS